jgi:hypothetical protein
MSMLQVQRLAAAFVEAWARASPANRARLAAAGLNPALAAAATAAVARGEAEGARDLRVALCRVVRLMEVDAAATTDADRAGWAQPVLFIAADAAAAGDLELADAAMQTLVHAARVGGPLVRGALRQLHLLPTIEALAAARDPKLRARAVAALAPLLGAGLMTSEGDRAAWRDRLLGWLVEGDALPGTAGAAGGDGAAARGGEEGGREGGGRAAAGWLPGLGWWRRGAGARRAEERRADAGAAELRKACVSGLTGAWCVPTNTQSQRVS